MLNVIKGALLSKTVVVAIATVLLTALSEPVQVWIAAHPGMAGTMAGLVMTVLRTMTTGSLASKVAPKV